MKRRIVGALMVVGLAAVLVAGNARPAYASFVGGVVGGLFYSADDSDVSAGATVSNDGAGTDVVIPSTVMLGSPAQSYAVTSIATLGFTSPPLTSVVIPDSVTTIGEQAFVHDTLTTVNIPDSVVTIDEGAFSQTDLTSVTLGNSLATIGDDAFEFDTSLSSVSIPQSVTTIGMEAFLGDALTSLVIPHSVTSIGDFAFNDNHLASVGLPDSLTSIGTGAFSQNDLTSVTIPDAVTTIGGDAFRDNDLTSVTIPGSVTAIGDDAFVDNPGLTRVEFTGAAPTTITAAADPIGASFDESTGLIVYYNWAFDAARAAGGFTMPTWKGYTTAELVTVRFDLDGHGVPAAPQDLAVGTTATQPTAPTAAGFKFTDWYTSPALTTKADFTDPITTNTTLYAGWTALAVTGVSIDPLTLPLTAAVLVLGLALILVATRRRRRA